MYPTRDDILYQDLAFLWQEPKSSPPIASDYYITDDVYGSYYDMDFIYNLTVFEVRDYNPQLRHTSIPEILFVYIPDRRPLFKALTGKRALGLSPPYRSLTTRNPGSSKELH